MENNDDLKKYVADLHLSTPSVSYPSTRAVGRDLVVEGEEQSFLNDKSLVSFVSAVSEQRRKDVLNSVLLAQMAANKQFPNEDQILDWYKQFVLVLNKLGWAIEAADFSTFKSSGNVFEAESAIIDILTTAFGGNLPAVIAKTLSAIKSLADNTGKITAFDKNTHSQTKGAFQIGLAKEENGTVSLQLGTFTLTSSNEIKKILFFKSTKDSTELKYCSRQGTLDEEVYATARQAIVDKLGGKINEFVVEIDI